MLHRRLWSVEFSRSRAAHVSQARVRGQGWRTERSQPDGACKGFQHFFARMSVEPRLTGE